MQRLTLPLQIAAKLSSGLGRDIMHVKLSEEQVVQRYLGVGTPEHMAKFLASIEVSTANGREETLNDAVKEVTGRPPQKFDVWIQENKATWQ
jgi:hypothetical protein